MSEIKKNVYLKKYVKFRREENYVLVCDLYTLDNYSFPIQFIDDFLKLSTIGMTDNNSDFLNDLKTLDLLDENKNKNINPNANIFDKLLYNENEFFN